MTTPTPPADFGLFTSLRYDPQLLNSSENTSLSGNNASSPFYHFVYHHDRFINGLDHFGWRSKPEGETKPGSKEHSKDKGLYPQAVVPVADIETFRKAASSAVERYQTAQGDPKQDAQPLKLRPVLFREGVLEIEVTPTPPTSMMNLFPPNPLPAPSDMKPPLLRTDFTLVIDSASMTPSSHTMYKTDPRPQYDLSRKRVGLISESEPREVILWNPAGNVMEGSRTNLYFYRGGKWVTPSEETGCLKGTVRRWLIESGMVEVKDLPVSDVKEGEVVLMSNGLRGIWAATVRAGS